MSGKTGCVITPGAGQSAELVSMRLTLVITAEQAGLAAAKQLILMPEAFQNKIFIKDYRVSAGFVILVLFCLRMTIPMSAPKAVPESDFMKNCFSDKINLRASYQE